MTIFPVMISGYKKYIICALREAHLIQQDPFALRPVFRTWIRKSARVDVIAEENKRSGDSTDVHMLLNQRRKVLHLRGTRVTYKDDLV